MNTESDHENSGDHLKHPLYDMLVCPTDGGALTAPDNAVFDPIKDGLINNPTIDFGNVHVGTTLDQALSIDNDAADDNFSERLNGSMGGTSGSARLFQVPARADGGVVVHSFELACGLRVHVAPRPEVPVVAIRSALLGGQLAETAESAGLTSFLLK